MPDLQAIDTAAEALALEVFGAFHTGPEDDLPHGTGTLVLLGPREPGFWDSFTASTEYRDGQPDPLDRWSTRTVGTLASRLHATALFPFGGPPYRPFLSWAVRSGRAWSSPVGLLVHDRAGLMVSYRGALALPGRLKLPEPGENPCLNCAEKPCQTACPAAAMTRAGYDVPACKSFLKTPAGQDCYESGCQVRRACPVSRQYGRSVAQSGFHMRAFHP